MQNLSSYITRFQGIDDDRVARRSPQALFKQRFCSVAIATDPRAKMVRKEAVAAECVALEMFAASHSQCKVGCTFVERA